MHIPDGFLSGPINCSTALISGGVLASSIIQIRKLQTQSDFTLPLMATTASFIFAAQMLNFPIGGGTSGHFLGAVTAAALLGPSSACLIFTIILFIQAVLFGDGGITALGSNIFNMGIVGGILCYPVMRLLRAFFPAGLHGFLLSVALTSWLSVILASIFCSLELAASATIPLRIALPAMAGTHAIIGIGEALITVALLASVAASRPEILPEWANCTGNSTSHILSKNMRWGVAGIILLLSCFLAILAGFFASSLPDGLEKFALSQGFSHTETAENLSAVPAVFADYAVPFIHSEKFSTSVAGLLGTCTVFVVGFFCIRWATSPASKQ